MSNKARIREELREKKRVISPAIAERTEFINFVRTLVPDIYRHQTETNNCFSVFRDYSPLHAAGFSDKRKNLEISNARLSKKYKHVFGNHRQPCERCLRIINAYSLYHALVHQDLLTPEAKIIIKQEHKQRKQEAIDIKKGLLGDRLYLIQLIVPYRGDINSAHFPDFNTNELVFYDSKHVRFGQQTLELRLRNKPELKQDACSFGQISQCHLRSIPHEFYSSKSQTDREKYHDSRLIGRDTTTIEIIARSDYKEKLREERLHN